MGYFDFVGRFDVALFDRSSFDFLGYGLTDITLPLNAAVEVPSYSINMEVPTYSTTVEVPTYSATISVPTYTVSVSVPDYEVDVSIG